MTLFDHEESTDSSDPFSKPQGSLDEGAGHEDDLASTPQPPPDQRDEATRKRYEMLRENAAKARKFYEADRTLDQEDRVTLFKAYRSHMFSQYGGALVGLAVGITAPRYFCKYFGRTYKPAYSTLTGVVTVIAGYGFAERIAYDYNLQKYQGNKKYTTILKSTDKYPPIIGYAYYQETFRRPDSTFPDPSKIDWTRYPSFPLILTAFNWYRSDVKGITDPTAPLTYQRGRSTGNAPTAQVPHTDFDTGAAQGDETQIRASGAELDSDYDAAKSHAEPTTWEKIREQNKNKKFQWEPQQVQPAHPGSRDTQYDPQKWQDRVQEKADDDFFKDSYDEKK